MKTEKEIKESIVELQKENDYNHKKDDGSLGMGLNILRIEQKIIALEWVLK